jgi:hypothetical protein
MEGPEDIARVQASATALREPTVDRGDFELIYRLISLDQNGGLA